MSAQTSVIIPVRNGERFLADAMSSVLSQLHDADQLLVVDDGSTDRTSSIVATFRDSRVTLLKLSGRGVSAARNVGLAAATGEFVAFLDHDDLWPSSRHELMMGTLVTHPEFDAAFGRVRVRFEPGAYIPAGARTLDGKHICELVGTALYRRRVLESVGGFAEDMQLREDADFFLRLSELGLRPIICDVDGVIYRRHDTNATNNEAQIVLGMTDIIRRKLMRARLSKRKV